MPGQWNLIFVVLGAAGAHTGIFTAVQVADPAQLAAFTKVLKTAGSGVYQYNIFNQAGTPVEGWTRP